LKRQTDLFATTADVRQAVTLDPASMERMTRPRLAALLEEARQAETLPWNEQRTPVNALLFHNMSNWLPAPQRNRLRAAFVAELARLRGIRSCPTADRVDSAAARNVGHN
jgi:hypothetical protein